MQKMELMIGNKNYSSWSLRPWFALKRSGLEFDEIKVDLYTPGSAEKIRAFNSSGKVPALRAGEMVLWESLAICEFAAEHQPLLWPLDFRNRCMARSVATEMHGGFPNIRSQLSMNCRATGRKVELTEATKLEIERVEEVWTDCRNAHNLIGPWLFGCFTIADAMYAPVVSRFHTYGIKMNYVCEEYIHFVLNTPEMLEWYAAAREETAIIESSETGLA